MTYRIYTQRSDYRRSMDLVIVQERPDGTYTAKPLEFEKAEDHSVWTPTIVPVGIVGKTGVMRADGESFLQACLDHAWDCGLRPRGLFDTTQEISAVKAHLDDMRALVFKRPPQHVRGPQS